MNTARILSYFKGVAARRIVTPRPESTRHHASPAVMAVDGPACCGSGRGMPVPRTIRARLSNKLVIDDLRPRLHRASRAGQRPARHPLPAHLLRLFDVNTLLTDVEHVGHAKVYAAHVG